MKISELPVATTLNNTSKFIVVHNGVTKQVSKEVLDNSLSPIPLTVLIDTVSSALSYIGKATPGALSGSSVWQIQRISTNPPTVTIEFASNGLFVNVWNDRATLTYA